MAKLPFLLIWSTAHKTIDEYNTCTTTRHQLSPVLQLSSKQYKVEVKMINK